LGNLNLCSPKNNFLGKNCSWATNLKKLFKGNLFSSILFVDEEENLGKGLNLGPLGYKGGF
jgi:hypothetical protein